MPAWPAGRKAVVVEPRPLVAGGDPVVGQGGGVLLSTVVQLFDIAVYRNDLQLSTQFGLAVHHVADESVAVVVLADDILREFEDGPVPMLAAPVGCRFERPKTAACVDPKPQNRRSL